MFPNLSSRKSAGAWTWMCAWMYILKKFSAEGFYRISYRYGCDQNLPHRDPGPNRDRKVRPGMFSRVTIDLGSTMPAGPDQSIVKQQGSGERYVYVYKDGKAIYTVVELGRRLDAYYECLSGLEEGDCVITTGLNRLTNGAEVELVN